MNKDLYIKWQHICRCSQPTGRTRITVGIDIWLDLRVDSCLVLFCELGDLLQLHFCDDSTIDIDEYY